MVPVLGGFPVSSCFLRFPAGALDDETISALGSTAGQEVLAQETAVNFGPDSDSYYFSRGSLEGGDPGAPCSGVHHPHPSFCTVDPPSSGARNGRLVVPECRTSRHCRLEA